MNKSEYLEDIQNRMTYDKSMPGDGWTDLIIECHRKLIILDPEYRILQIKEKFGSLRYYFDTDVKEPAVKEAMYRYVKYAENSSKIVCEKCGGASEIKRTKTGWLKAYCNECSVGQEFERVEV